MGAVGLREFLEDDFLRLLGNSNACIGDAETKRAFVAGLFQTLDTDLDMAFLGELDRIGHQVDQYLPEIALVGAHMRKTGGAIDLQLQPLAVD